MRPNEVLVTGLSMVDVRAGCQICNYNYSWLFENPSTLLWADKIIVTPHIKMTIDSEKYPKRRSAISRLIRMAFEVADKHGLVEVRDPNEIITPAMIQRIDEEIATDRKVLPKLFPKQIRIGDEKNVPGQIFIEGIEYCSPHIASIHISLMLAQKWNLQCLFAQEDLNYCKFKFGSSLVADQRMGYPPSAFDTILNMYLPEYNVFHSYMRCRQDCKKCVHEEKCRTEYLETSERNLTRYLELREYDEVVQIRQVVSNVIQRLKSEDGLVEHDEVIKEFRNEEMKLRRRIRSTFPRVDRLSCAALIASVPITVVGLATGLPFVSAAGATVSGISTIVREYVRYTKSRYKWIGFVNKSVSSASLLS